MSNIRYGFVIDLRKCIGCHTCSVACKRENAVPLGVWRSWVKQVEKGTYPYIRKSFLPLLCNNCESPICVTVCPVKASYQRKDGIAMVDPIAASVAGTAWLPALTTCAISIHYYPLCRNAIGACTGWTKD